ncbi:S41 family peptidase [Chryseobacterium sp. RRHN12]|uniref:S41 family peptidase n=1 Tax=Chryseobacterium sp. RRHN12 TaxID=3437884 RepID=UPI003D9B9CE3
MKKIITVMLSAFLFCTSTHSCIKEDEVREGAPNRNINENIKSYADLFTVFWTVMDERYNFFYEQKKRDGMDWTAVYNEYYPKFLALKSYQQQGFSEHVIQADARKAKEYFTKIIDPIMDRHYAVYIDLPSLGRQAFGGNDERLKQTRTYGFDKRAAYMKEHLREDAFESETLLAGYLKANPDIFYVAFSMFDLSQNVGIFSDDYSLKPVANPLTIAEIENAAALQQITDANTKSAIRQLSVSLFNEWSKAASQSSAEITNFNVQMKTFKDTELISPALSAAGQKLYAKFSNLKDYESKEIYGSLLSDETKAYIRWFIGRMNEHINTSGLSKIVMASWDFDLKTEFYRKFLNPLTNGKIKKVIIDLRDNGGGQIIDSRFFVDRFVTKEVVYGYQRTKEGAGRFNYTPWIEERAIRHQFAIPAPIPMAILTNGFTASMGEAATLTWKSQGPQVVSIGNYTTGATAGLGPFTDFNGGTYREKFGGKIEFIMPMMAFKDAGGQVIEGIGIKPDIAVPDPTDTEIAAMEHSPKTFIDRVMTEAVKYLSSQ